MIALLIIRLLGVIPLAIDYHKPNDMIIPSFETLIFWFTEFFPVLMLMFSFITFGSSSNDDIESIEEFNDTIERSSSKVMRESDIYEYNYTHFSINNNSIAENSATQKLISQLKLDEHKSLDQHAASEQVNASILWQEIETDDENSSKGRDTIPKNRETKEFDQNPQENDGANNGEGIIFRDDHLKCAFKQMIGEMGMSRPSNFSLSALDENSDSD